VHPLAFIGGTGAEGLGLAVRLAAAGQAVLIGSRVRERAVAAAERVRATVPGAQAEGLENLVALARANRVFLTLPFGALTPFLDRAGAGLAGKLVIDVIVPVVLRDRFFALVPIPGAASAGELIQHRVPTARVVSAFKNLAAEALGDLATPLEGDVVLCGNDRAARREVEALIALLPGLRAVDAGRLANAGYVEAVTALLLNLNRRYGARTSIAVLGLPRAGAAAPAR
jgi:hypothetical protein